MTIGTQFVRGSNPVWYFVDLVGNQTDGSFYLWTLTNTIPYIPQAVFHDVNGLIPWTDPIEFLANGTLPIDIFFDDTQVYRLEIRQNDGTAPPSQADALIYLVENYIPNGSGGGITPFGAGIISGNEITNPQFALINFQSPLVLTGVTNPPPIEIAPGWFLNLTGTGNITVNQIPLNTTFPNPTNAPYALSFNSSGWSNPPILSQRFYQNGMNWQNKTVATSVTARIDGASQNILVRMIASNGNNIAILINAPLTNTFTEFQGNDLIPTFANLNLPPNAYIDYQIILPQNGVSYVTSVQVTESATIGNVEYIQDTINRQLDHTFHYYMPKLEYKPITSYLIGWDFPLNPAQFFGDNVPIQNLGANTSYYAWDQTIIFQTVTSAITVSRSTNAGISLTVQQAGSFAMVQYLERSQAVELLSQKMAVYLEGSSVSNISGTISIWATSTTLPSIITPTFQSLVSAVDANGVVTAGNGTWTKVPRGSFPDAAFTLTGNLQDLQFNGWQLLNNALLLDATYLAIVVSFASATAANVIEIDKISLNAGDIATRPAPKTTSETLLDCQKFFFSTFPPGAEPATAYGVNTGGISGPLNRTSGYHSSGLFPTTMRGIPTLIIYNPVTANNQIYDVSVPGDCSASTNGLNLTAKTYDVNGVPPAGSAAGDIMQFHLTADARMGVV
jgi:hypothetical protein